MAEVPKEYAEELEKLNAEFAMADAKLKRLNTAVRSSLKVQEAFVTSLRKLEQLNKDVASAEKLRNVEESFRELQVTTEQEAIRYKKMNAKGQEVFIDEEQVLPKVQFKEVKPTVVQMSKAAVDAVETKFVKGCYLDRQYGEIATIDGLWLYKDTLDPEKVINGLQMLLDEVPTLSGRCNRKKCGFDLTNDGALVYVREATGSYKDLAQDISPRDDWIDKAPVEELVVGKAPMMTVTITHMMEGGTVLGVVVSHMVAGGNGWFGYVMPRFAALVKYQDPAKIPEGSLGSVRCVESRDSLPGTRRTLKDTKKMIQTKLKEQGLHPASFRDPIFGPLKRRAMYALLRGSRGRPRVHTHFGPKELKRLKAEALKGCTKTKWLSTGEALCAHIARIICTNAPTLATTPTHIGAIIDHAGRVKAIPEGALANTFYVYSLNFKKWMHKQTLSEVAEQIHEQVQGILSNEEAMIEVMEIEEDLLRWNYQPNIHLDLALPITYNNQSKFKALILLDFGTGVCERYIPHNAGDSILLTPSPDGGIDCWMSTVLSIVGNPSQLVEAHFSEKIHMYRN